MSEIILDSPMLQIHNYYRPELLRTPEEVNRHQQICELPVAPKANNPVAEFKI